MSKQSSGFLKSDEYRGFFDAFKKIYREEGALSFYRGFNAYIIAVKYLLN